MSKTCLVVDDSRVVRRAARAILEELAFEVTEAENGEVALEQCSAAMPDAILLDWNMPKADGPSFLRALRARPDGDEPKVIFCTTESDLDRISTAIEIGANEYIMKPFDSEIIKEKLSEVGLIDPN
ncbi:response regulator [Amorphus orientalis]|uniref:Two-component system chemotaxis response regulator CheY n=1 Tax=Amorphus orientalis TaxID=649198 RepID=A0AAE3VTQ8_9HYPH|nr:response regulator [Amorphus orientalis]MDQ0317658.1 two-component system chemotaxis response regulator CheY [Amorphus orientalis]